MRLAGERVNTRFIQIDDLPIYNADLKTERPTNVNRFMNEVADSNAVLVVMPVHNRPLPSVLKNAIDRGAKPVTDNVWKCKVTAITGTSPGAIGTAVGQQHLRQILGILGALVVDGKAYISYQPNLIDKAGAITTRISPNHNNRVCGGESPCVQLMRSPKKPHTDIRRKTV